MSIGVQTIRRINRIEDQAKRLGMQFAASRYGGERDVIALVPIDDEFPIYARDAELFVGSLDECESFLTGFERSRHYDKMLRLSDEKKRARKEQDVRNEQLVRILKKDKANDPTE